MHLSDFDFELPEDLIALRPVKPRPASRLLAVEGGAQRDLRVRDLPDLLRAGDMLVFNDTRVIPARLRGERRRDTSDGPGRAQIEVTLAERLGPARWRVLAKPGKRLRAGDRVTFTEDLSAEVTDKEPGGFILLDFSLSGEALDGAVERAGEMPLPPYIAGRRAADAQDRDDYQTVFAAKPGAVAAPTASLHFDAELLARLEAAGVLSTRVTLHVGAGTFLPVTAERLDDHKMHSEWGEVTAEAAAAVTAAKAAGGRIIPVGTTALRLIESAAERGVLNPWRGPTDIFIRPGYRFQISDGLMTNFHLPKSTLMMLVSALMGVERMREIYAHAIAERYRFFSYGDSSLLLPDTEK
ncbi:MAG: tRNA preQ1(34) S-adenosylmethionine ribosyltransferase-isomerase QueA [Pseudomonadota bacterium]